VNFVSTLLRALVEASDSNQPEFCGFEDQESS